MENTGFALKLVEQRTFLSNSILTYFYRTRYRCDVAGVTGTEYTDTPFGNNGKTNTYYFTGNANLGDTIYVLVSLNLDSSTGSSTFTAPGLLVTITFDAQKGSACETIVCY